MIEGIKKYIVISASILLLLMCLGVCWLFKFQWQLVFLFTYLTGIATGMIIIGVENYDE